MTFNDDEIVGSLVIPKWFLYVFSILTISFNMMFIPWAAWVTSALFRIDATTSAYISVSAKVDTLGEKVAHLEGQYLRHLDTKTQQQEPTEN